MSIYLDYAATAPLKREVFDIYTEQLQTNYANPASLHGPGLEAEKSLNLSRKKIAELLGAAKARLILTSGGSESINTALKGLFQVKSRQGKKLIISAGEHPAVRKTADFLESRGIKLDVLPLTARGTIDLDCLEKALAEPTALLSIIHVSNETGAVNPLREITAVRNRCQPDTLIHLDAVQAPGKIALDFSRLGVDMLSGSGHKIGAPKGIGWLLLRRGIHLEPLIHGGGQQDNMRAGTENAPLAAALAAALELTVTGTGAGREKVRTLRDYYISLLDDYGIRYELVSPADGVPHILAIAFPGIRAETMLHALEAKQVYVSAGSACSSRKRQINPVLKAMRLQSDLAESTIRLSFAPELTAGEMATAAAATYECYKYLRRI